MDKATEAALVKAGFAWMRHKDGCHVYRRVSGDREDYVKVYFATQTVDWHSYFPLEGILALLTRALPRRASHRPHPHESTRPPARPHEGGIAVTRITPADVKWMVYALNEAIIEYVESKAAADNERAGGFLMEFLRLAAQMEADEARAKGKVLVPVEVAKTAVDACESARYESNAEANRCAGVGLSTAEVRALVRAEGFEQAREVLQAIIDKEVTP
jgi:hypothetical protein